MASPLRRMLAFERELLRRCAATVDLPWGEAVVRRDLPLVHDLNTVIVDAVPADAAEVVPTTDALLAGLPHRRLRVESAMAARELLPHVKGWNRSRHLGMALLRPADRATDVTRARMVPLADYRHFDRAAIVEEPWASPPAADQLGARLDLYADACELTCFLATVGGQPAAGCLLLADGAVAEVDAVQVLTAFRGRGYGREVTAAAVAHATRTNRSLIYLFADAHDWPRELYGRLGFDEVGAVDYFVRLRVPTPLLGVP